MHRACLAEERIFFADGLDFEWRLGMGVGIFAKRRILARRRKHAVLVVVCESLCMRADRR